MEKPIVAISTPLGKGAISIVRLSGKNSIDLALEFFKPIKKQIIEPRKMILGNFYIEDEKEKCLMVYFKEPYSYTGENMVEFHIHGGSVLTKLLQDKLIEKGARLAEPGEFTKIAFENGKISLDEAEGIIDEINSESEAELKNSLATAGGKIKFLVKDIQEKLKNVLAQIEVTMDYPEEDEFEVVREPVEKVLKETKLKLEDILENTRQKKYILKGINVAIIGKTNVGKSSLLNTLAGEDKAIVTDIEGTTRDLVEAKIDIEGVRFNFIDTAGIRESCDEVEKIGIERSREAMKNADITLFVLDGSKTIDEEDEKILSDLKGPYIIVVNKSDKQRKLKKFENEVEVSAKELYNIKKLKRTLLEKTIGDNIDFKYKVIANERQEEILKNALSFTKEAISKKHESLEIWSLLIKNIWKELGKITGETENEDIISLIFSKFCVGK